MVSQNRIRAARILAMSADLLQIGLFPIFGEGVVSPLNDILDVAVGGMLIWLVGWHFAFLPSFVAELVPIADLVPTWTIAVLIATRQKQAPTEDLSRGRTTVVVDSPPNTKAV